MRHSAQDRTAPGSKSRIATIRDPAPSNGRARAARLRVPNALDIDLELAIAAHAPWNAHGIDLSRLVLVIRRWAIGNCSQIDLDPVLGAMRVDYAIMTSAAVEFRLGEKRRCLAQISLARRNSWFSPLVPSRAHVHRLSPQVVDRRPVQLGASSDALIPWCSQASPQSKQSRPTASRAEPPGRGPGALRVPEPQVNTSSMCS